MLKTILNIILTLALCTTLAVAAPFMTSDPQSDIASHETEIPDLNITVVTIANPDGSLNLDLSQFPPGWHQAHVKSCDTYVVEDQTSGDISQIPECSASSPVRFKVPNANSGANYKIKP